MLPINRFGLLMDLKAIILKEYRNHICKYDTGGTNICFINWL